MHYHLPFNLFLEHTSEVDKDLGSHHEWMLKWLKKDQGELYWADSTWFILIWLNLGNQMVCASGAMQ